jgi:hypothetical protein
VNFREQMFASTREHLWPVLREVLVRFARDDVLSEGVCISLKNWLRFYGAAAAPILPELRELLPQVQHLTAAYHLKRLNLHQRVLRFAST